MRLIASTSQVLVTAAIALLVLLIPAAHAGPPQAAAGSAQAFRHPPAWVADQTLYEVNLRQFSPEGNVEGFRKQLPRLRSLGVGTLWFMPLNPIGITGRTGSLGSPYAVKDYRAFNPELGTLDQFKGAIDDAHRLGMHVIIDWVAPHTALDHPWVTQHPDWYKHDANGQLVPPVAAWHDVAGLNYDSAALRQEMIDSMAYWIRDVGVDGFRCDSAEFAPLDFWVQARGALTAIKPLFMLAEGNKPDLMNNAFDAAYAWDLPVNMEGIVRGTKTVADLRNFFEADARVLPSDGFRLNFTTNHDKNAFEGTTKELLGDGVAAFTVLTFTAPGMPMIFNGQENGAEHRLSLFDRDPIVWHADPTADLYATLSRLKRSNLALRQGPVPVPMQFLPVEPSKSVLAFKRQSQSDSIVVVLNLGPDAATIKMPQGLSQMQQVIGDRVDGPAGELALKPWDCRVWSTEK